MPKPRKILFFLARAAYFAIGLMPVFSGVGIPAATSAPLPRAQEGGPDPASSRLERLYKESRFFELRDAVASLKAIPGSDEEFYFRKPPLGLDQPVLRETFQQGIKHRLRFRHFLMKSPIFLKFLGMNLAE